MHSHNRPICEAVTSDVSCNKAVAAQSVYEPARQAGDSLFHSVRPLSFIPALSSVVIQTRKAKELTITFHHSIFVFGLLDAFFLSGMFPTGGALLLLVEYIPMYTLTPRFILSIRELYARDVEGRRGEGIDTGFGLSLSGRGAVVTPIAFTDVEQIQALEHIEEIPMEDGKNQSK